MFGSILFAIMLAIVPAQPVDDTEYELELVSDDFSSPLYVTAPANDHRLFVVERGGRVEVVENGVVLATPYIDVGSLLPASPGPEQGLLGMAFHPDYANNGRVFVAYTDSTGALRVVEYHANTGANTASPVKTIIRISQPFTNHNGGMLLFGPDGYLYISSGDGGGGGDPSGNGQNKNTLLGAILRIDVNSDAFPTDSLRNYSNPSTNPFVGQTGADEIWYYGLRNPWRIWIDPPTGRYYIADVGQGSREEVTILGASSGGANLGWDRLEGSICYPVGASCTSAGTVLPQVEYPHPVGGSITGGVVYRGSDLPELQGTYFYADFVEGWIRSFRYDGTVTEHKDWSPVFDTSLVSSFGVDGYGEMYVVSLGGSVWKLTNGADIDPLVADFTGAGPEDLAYLDPGTGVWNVGASTGSDFSFSSWSDFSPDLGWQSFPGDFDGDGTADVANYYTGSGTWWVSESTGSAFTTTSWSGAFSPRTGWSHYPGDFDGDGRSDIASYYAGNGTWWISRSTGSGFSTTLWSGGFSPRNGWLHYPGDFDGDGRTDIASYYSGNGTWWISRSTGSGFSVGLWSGGFSPRNGWLHYPGDFDGDGRSDIASFYSGNGTWWISRSTGSAFAVSLWSGGFSPKTGWTHVTGDFDDDGRSDVASYFAGNGTWWVSESTGSSFSISQWWP